VSRHLSNALTGVTPVDHHSRTRAASLRRPQSRAEAAPFAAWLAERGLSSEDATATDLERTRALREALRSLLVANAGEGLDDGVVERLNEIAAAAEVGLAFAEDGSARLASRAEGVAAAHGELLAIVHGAMVDGTWPRLKACRHCTWAFYDYSKNRSATWCSMKICGNRLKTRAYRARHPRGGSARTSHSG